ncbi:MAG: hypothetical protein JOZ41_08275 [Chloroflexi bacterium]|nr:hypothetical protein [Chloroflexota bacterium]
MKALKRTHVPLLLPGWLPPGPAYASIESVTPNRYSINLGLVPGCGGDACSLGSVEGETIARSTPPLRGRPIVLPRHITGYFMPFRCGASCGESTIGWTLRGYRYTFGIKGGSLKQLKRMATSALVDAR